MVGCHVVHPLGIYSLKKVAKKMDTAIIDERCYSIGLVFERVRLKRSALAGCLLRPSNRGHLR